MVEKHLHTDAAWRAWLEVLAAYPARAAELDARASLLYEQRGCLPELLPATLVEAARIEIELDRPVAPPVPRVLFVPLLAAAVIFVATGWAAARLDAPAPPPLDASAASGTPVSPDAAPAWRSGAAVVDLGSVRLEQARTTLASVVVGRGVRPRVTIGDGPLTLRWTTPPGRVALAWFVTEGGLGPPVPHAAVTDLEVPAGATALVVAVLPATASAESVIARIGDARSDVEPLGEVAVVAFDLVYAP